ncbi:ExbD/TolR family protein [Rubrivirga sp. IMCC45206]|uniref:ExbD/TolR family protein n=1 Tax=Rubrivirga sp. IMCC45206 TaxID=3391614 RepID=UPI00398F99E2
MSARRAAPAIPTASMADIAFLLLLFFLVATAIVTDRGIPIDLPPKLTHHGPTLPSAHTVLVAADGAVRLDGARVSPDVLRERIAASAQAGAPLITLQAHARTPYAAYVDALDGVLMGHRDADATPRLRLREPAR